MIRRAIILVLHLTCSFALCAWGQAPSVTWWSHKYDTVYLTNNEIEIDITLKISTHSTLKALTVFIVNGRDGSIIAKHNEPLAVSQYNLRKKINLPEDIIHLKVEVSDTENRLATSAKTFIYNNSLIEEKIGRRNDHALIFATDKYSTWPQLVNPIFDARTVAEKLEGIYGFTTEIIENATEEVVASKIKEYQLREYNQFDQLLIFFAGHGGYNKYGGYIVASDTKSPSEIVYPLEFRWAQREIDRIPVNHILLVMDVCFGGTLQRTVESVNPNTTTEEDIYGVASQLEILKRKFSRISRLYITSGGEEYVSDGRPGMHSPFTSQLIKALDRKGFGDNLLTNAEVKGFMENLKVEPRFGNFGNHEEHGDFILTVKQN